MRLTQGEYIRLLGVPAFCSHENADSLLVETRSDFVVGARNGMTYPVDSPVRVRHAVQAGVTKRMGK